MKEYRVGFGFDVHRISKKKKKLILGGSVIPCPFGLEAVSDGDVVLHAISDALCGATVIGDIGDYFPPEDKSCKNIDSKLIVKEILKKTSKNFKTVNLDITIIAEKPRLIKYKKRIISSLRKIISVKNINLKIKSKEGLSILGGVNAMACVVIVLMKRAKAFKNA
ncbi:MAG: 2-C-methyl-D-erythritol 2,4-cyclodiphosphate synthase [Candidatus Omnitrophica bacterium]|nr:2-C-methyl-D-erythritol 2,4-cyclodiphosphate synthase [Candidatus Omnitrophota bacterium]